MLRPDFTLPVVQMHMREGAEPEGISVGDALQDRRGAGRDEQLPQGTGASASILGGALFSAKLGFRAEFGVPGGVETGGKVDIRSGHRHGGGVRTGARSVHASEVRAMGRQAAGASRGHRHGAARGSFPLPHCWMTGSRAPGRGDPGIEMGAKCGDSLAEPLPLSLPCALPSPPPPAWR